ncbi:MAG: hypothetical protein OEY52_06420 [Gammaproteobacteria bacterium]|nr:hypothetical protein [Gammaproteobacteria bacterium]
MSFSRFFIVMLFFTVLIKGTAFAAENSYQTDIFYSKTAEEYKYKDSITKAFSWANHLEPVDTTNIVHKEASFIRRVGFIELGYELEDENGLYAHETGYVAYANYVHMEKESSYWLNLIYANAKRSSDEYYPIKTKGMTMEGNASGFGIGYFLFDNMLFSYNRFEFNNLVSFPTGTGGYQSTNFDVIDSTVSAKLLYPFQGGGAFHLEMTAGTKKVIISKVPQQDNKIFALNIDYYLNSRLGVGLTHKSVDGDKTFFIGESTGVRLSLFLTSWLYVEGAYSEFTNDDDPQNENYELVSAKLGIRL